MSTALFLCCRPTLQCTSFFVWGILSRCQPYFLTVNIIKYSIRWKIYLFKKVSLQWFSHGYGLGRAELNISETFRFATRGFQPCFACKLCPVLQTLTTSTHRGVGQGGDHWPQAAGLERESPLTAAGMTDHFRPAGSDWFWWYLIVNM